MKKWISAKFWLRVCGGNISSFWEKKIEKRATKLFLACARAPFIRAKLDRDRKKENNERDIKCAKERKEWNRLKSNRRKSKRKVKVAKLAFEKRRKKEANKHKSDTFKWVKFDKDRKNDTEKQGIKKEEKIRSREEEKEKRKRRKR